MAERKKKLNIYLDNCCFNRPYDDQSQLRIELETRAKLFIQNLIEERRIDLTVSSMLMFENNDNPFKDRKLAIAEFIKNATLTVNATEEVKSLTQTFVNKGVKIKDATHVACAITAKCEYFITTDKKLLRQATEQMRIIDPTEFIRIWEGKENDE